MSTTTARYVIAVLLADRVAILKDITAALSDLNGNIDGIRQTVVNGYFTVSLTAVFDPPKSAEQIRQALATKFAGTDASIVVMEHHLKAIRQPVRGDRYILTIAGPPHPDLLKTVTAFLAEKGVNIEDWHLGADNSGASHIGEVTIPQHLDLKQIQDEFRQTLAPMGLRSCIQHENIFRATNEVCAIRTLLEGKSHA